LTWTIVGAAAGVTAVAAGVWGTVAAARITRREETTERQRLKEEVLGQPSSNRSPGRAPGRAREAPAPRSAISAARYDPELLPVPAPPSDEVPPADQVPKAAEVPPTEETPWPKGPPADEVPPTDELPDFDEFLAALNPHAEENARYAEESAASRDTAYDELLINDYALGLTQARRAFNVSMLFSIFGGLVLITGVGLAIFRAETGGQVAAAAITSAAGVLTSGLSQLFRGQSTKALKHLESQATELRQDVRAQNNVGKALRLLDDVSDVELRSRLQAALILEFTGAKLPDLCRQSDIQPGTYDGHVHGSTDTVQASPST
jgi:hypothetical protein